MFHALHTLDRTLYRAINFGLTSPVLDPVALALSSEKLWAIVALALTGFGLIRGQRKLLHALFTLTLAVAVSDASCYYVLKPTFERVRPCHGTDARRVNGICGSTFGMPSNHASNGMAAATVVRAFFGPRWFAVASSVALLVGLSRVYLGVHYPADILAGFAFGILFGTVAVWVLGPRRKKA